MFEKLKVSLIPISAGILIGIIFSGLIILIVSPPRGKAIKLETPSPRHLITVHIDGEINNPGIYQISPDMKLYELVDIAGGLSESAMTDSINLAASLLDGQKISIPSSDPSSQNEKDTVENIEKININSATSEELQTLPGIGQSKAEDIIEYRSQHGYFALIEDIMEVPGIGFSTFEKFKNMITTEFTIP